MGRHERITASKPPSCLLESKLSRKARSGLFDSQERLIFIFVTSFVMPPRKRTLGYRPGCQGLRHYTKCWLNIYNKLLVDRQVCQRLRECYGGTDDLETVGTFRALLKECGLRLFSDFACKVCLTPPFDCSGCHELGTGFLAG
eukprot:m.139570 g.139570  ORF g.139570 m.139570 type:complete len:143 (-) comp24076_c0_seq4:791-1219(-)